MSRVTLKIPRTSNIGASNEMLDLPAEIDYAVVGAMLYFSDTPGPQAYSVLSTALGKWTVMESAEEIHRRFSDARPRSTQGMTTGERIAESKRLHDLAFLSAFLNGPPERLTEYGPSDVSTGTAADSSTPPIPNRVMDRAPQPNDPALRKRNTWPHSAA